MSPKNIQLIQKEVAIVWDDGSESFITLEKLRRNCPCAACSGETDVMGNEYRGALIKYGPQSFQVSAFQPVGGYAVQFTWGDGHNSGIYSYSYLKKLGESN
jgi:DUF971 family protein